MISLHRLPNQQRGEECQLFLRRHWIEIVYIFGYFLVLIAVPALIILLLNLIGVDIANNPVWGPLTAVFIGMYSFAVVSIVMAQITDYYLDTWIVTTERIINIEQKGLFARVVSELHLNQIQDVTSETLGFLPTVLSYGDVFIQTAGTRERFNFKNIDNPEEVKKTISRLVNEDKMRHGDASKLGLLDEGSSTPAA